MSYAQIQDDCPSISKPTERDIADSIGKFDLIYPELLIAGYYELMSERPGSPR